MAKIDRRKVLLKYRGKCAYCGCPITLKNFQVDHIHPQYKSHWPEGKNINREENLNPACRSCNNFKSTMDIPTMRKELAEQIERALRMSSQVRRAVKYGQIKLTPGPIVFWFEICPNLPKEK